MADTATAPAGPAVGNVPALLRDHIDQVAQDGTLLDQFVALTMLKRDLAAIERRLKAHIADREQDFLAELARRGENKAGHAATGKTAYINRRVWARVARTGETATPAEHQAAAQRLRDAGLPEYQGTKVDVQGLSAHFRGLAKQEADRRAAAGDPRPVQLDELLPNELRGFIDLTEDHVLGLR